MSPSSTRPRQRGASMVEALVALVVLSFSALGYAALQVKGVSSNASALTRSKATQLAADMGDRMRANNSADAMAVYTAFKGSEPPPSCGTAGSPCSPADMAQLDISQWLTTVASELPEGSGLVCLDDTPAGGTPDSPGCDAGSSVLAVKVFWKEHGEDQPPVWISLRP